MKISDQDLDKLNGKIVNAEGKAKYYSGCNFYVNKGTNKWEPNGTSTSMHVCGECAQLETCELKKTTPVWRSEVCQSLH